MKREPVVIKGQPIGRLKAGWLLFKEAFRFMWADREMLWLPILSAIANLIIIGAVFALLIVAVFTISPDFFEKYDEVYYLFALLIYIGAAFTLAFSQAAVAHLVFVRAHGGDATLMEALKKAFSHWWALLGWSVIAGTVGLLLRAIFERSELLGKILVAIIGTAWGVLTYFVVPAIVIDGHGPVQSIKRSGLVFKQTWGESLTSNISFGLLFFLAHLAAIFTGMGMIMFGVMIESAIVIIVALVLLVVWMVAFSLVSSSISAVLRTLLYIYATEGTIPQNFDHELLEKMLARKGVAVPPATTVEVDTVSPDASSAPIDDQMTR